MSASLINRSLTNVRTELDFLRESEVISEETFNKIMHSLPQKYDPNQHNDNRSRDSSESHAKLEYVEALYAFQPQQDGDLELRPGDKIQVLEKPSAEWYKGKCGGQVGMFPSNYVKPAFSGESSAPKRPAGPPYQPQQQHLAAPMYQQPQNTGYSQSSNPPFPPQSANYYPPQQQQQPQQVVVEQQQPHKHNAFKKFGSQLGNAAIFGAGATIGSDIVNSIF
ncbi:Pin3p KNAG_0A07990 [Huiozyma naganishii CBS 8797]|uniref:SH3 domain-containing protein n=1 Tax=Huiozyma naganishii (strain ATCC MYA-139 / BCRC 22969 / CBS 8797 / KCTC 17520 / NBRC 10181 / NCYC 3082 / Yp74L-3) TaxID=1071383 RepID=J7RUE7_HUIN7|nr:hypothetical protein KNAG_0A07990 [Kazachstania naganishii CBS 8797]CCK68452.1 hypothetical protein KNAG_0A07990 [Kazachstania naganishii CBS 8797]